MRTKYSMTLARQRGRMAAAAKTRSPLVRDAERRAAAALSLSANKAEDTDSAQHGDAESADCRYIQRVMVLRGLARDHVVADASNMLERARKAALDAHADRRLIDAVDLREPKSAVERDAERRLLESYGWDGAE